MNLKWNEVTWYSKLGALILFLIILPCITFIIGEKYQDLKNIESEYSKISLFPPPTPEENISVTYSTSTVSNPSIDFNISTPVISLLSNKTVQKKINDGIKTDIEKVIFDYKSNILPCTGTKGQVCKSTVGITSTTSVSLRFNSLSIEIDSFLTSEQRAHPDSQREIATTFTLATGDEKKYYDVLGIDKSVLLQKLSEISRIKLKDAFPSGTFIDIDVFLKGTEPNEENYKYVLLNDEGMRIFFNYYQVGPRPIGAPEVFIKYSELGL